MKLINKTILITGGGAGIGLALATVLAKQNNKVIITGRSLDKLQEAKKLIPSLQFFQSDVADPVSIDLLFEQLKQQGVVLDVLFNNAGVIETWDIANQFIPSAAIFNKIDTNLAGPISIVQQFIHQADRSKENYIINVTTDAAIMPVPILPLYSSSKAGLSAFTQALRMQLTGSKFKVVEIIPPAVETKMTTEDLNNTTKLVKPDHFALNVVKKIEAGKLEYAPSINAMLLKLIRRFFPKSGLKLIDKVSRKQLL
jgi:uncharacterized oxidoreductase